MSKQNYLQKRLDESVITARLVFIQINLHLFIDLVRELAVNCIYPDLCVPE